LSADAFDVRDVDYAATDFPDLNFIVEHVGLPRLDVALREITEPRDNPCQTSPWR